MPSSQTGDLYDWSDYVAEKVVYSMESWTNVKFDLQRIGGNRYLLAVAQ
jgi:hypothetical protein